MTVHIPGALRSYTGQKSEVGAEGRTVGEVLAALDRRHPGLRFRIITEHQNFRE
jgi:sulfur-carrier protein